MNLIEQALQDAPEDTSLLREVVARRLRGEHLDIPYNVQLMERPHEALVKSFRELGDTCDSIAAPTLRDLIESAIGELNEAIAESRESGGSQRGRFAWHLELLGLLEKLDCKVLYPNIAALCDSILNFEDTYNALTIDPITRISSQAISCDTHGCRFQSICLRLLSAGHPDGRCSNMIAEASPGWYLETGVMVELVTLRQMQRIPASRHKAFTESIRRAVFSLSERKATSTRLGSLIKPLMGLVSNGERAVALRGAIVSGIALSGAPANLAWSAEATFWKGHSSTNVVGDRKFELLRERVRDHLGNALGANRADGPAPPIRMNHLPYAEAGLVKVFELCARSCFDQVVTSSSEVRFADALNSLLENKIQLAIQNKRALESISSGARNEILISSGSIFHYLEYDLLVNGNCLESLLQGQTLSEKARKTAQHLLNGKSIDSNNLEPPQMESFAELFKRGKVTTLLGSDTHHALSETFGDIDGFNLSEVCLNYDPDEGLERFIDGEAMFYLGGALQSNYARSMFGFSVSKAISIRRAPLEEFLFTTRENYRLHQDSYNNLLRSWNGVSKIWGFLTEIKSTPKSLRGFIPPLRTDIVEAINQDRATPCGFVNSFSELSKIIAEHDEILNIAGKPEFVSSPAPPAEDEPIRLLMSAERGRRSV